MKNCNKETIMNAVKTLEKIERFFDRNHNAFIRFGGLFALLFFTLFVPYNIQYRTESELTYQLSQYQQANGVLTTRLGEMQNEVQFLQASYEQKKRVMQEVECLARNIYFEAGGEPRVGKIAVAEVTMNRVKSRIYPKTVCGVVHQKRQFSWVGNKSKVKDNHAWRESVKIAENILISKKRYSTIGDAMFFHATYIEKPEDFAGLTAVAKIGNHIFYRK